jgi:hypothetical protein
MSKKSRAQDESLVEFYVASFEKLDEMIDMGIDDVAQQLAVSDPDEHGWRCWRAMKIETDPSFLDPIYSKVPGRFPPLYEKLVLSYRWAQVHLDSHTLFPNAPGPDLSGLLRAMSRDPAMWGALLPAGYIQFAKGTDMDYDAVCFDLSSRKKNRDYKIVKIDHEEILCNNRIKVVGEVAPSFEQLVRDTIEQAGKV